MYDLIVVGGGPCGVMASIEASKKKKKVLLLDQNNQLLLKLEASGNGRCNLTNNKDIKDFMKNIDNNKYFYNIIQQFDSKKIIEYFKKLNVDLKEENDNRIYPVSDDAKTISNALIQQLKNTTVHSSEKVLNVKKNQYTFEVITDKATYQSEKLLLATGGITFKELGCSSKNHELAKSFEHTITNLTYQECPLETKEPLDKLMGVAIKDVEISIKDDAKTIEQFSGDVLLTHFGLSGPGILNCSFTINNIKNKDKIKISLSLLNKNFEQTRKIILDIIDKHPTKNMKNCLNEYLVNSIVIYILDKLEISTVKNCYLSKQQITNLSNLLSNFSFDFKSFYKPEYAFVTGGGINTKELVPKTLESKKVSNLYFGGELIDVCGKLGGYNISIALACGYVVGNNI